MTKKGNLTTRSFKYDPAGRTLLDNFFLDGFRKISHTYDVIHGFVAE